MKLTKEFPLFLVAVVLIALCAGGHLYAAVPDGRQITPAGKMPAQFVENCGQFGSANRGCNAQMSRGTSSASRGPSLPPLFKSQKLTIKKRL